MIKVKDIIFHGYNPYTINYSVDFFFNNKNEKERRYEKIWKAIGESIFPQTYFSVGHSSIFQPFYSFFHSTWSVLFISSIQLTPLREFHGVLALGFACHSTFTSVTIYNKEKRWILDDHVSPISWGKNALN